jgi:hypothetical protein
MAARARYHKPLYIVAARAHPGAVVPEPASPPCPPLRAQFRAPLSIDAVWLAGAPLALVLAALLTPIRPFDYFWALVQGRAIVQLGRIPSENLFLYTLPPDAPFFDQPWLGQLAMYAAFRLGGHAANLLLHAALLASGMLVVMDTALRLSAKPRTVAVLALLVTPLLVLGAGVRTQMFAYPCFALVLRGAILRPPQGGWRSLVPCVVAAALWANVHGSFVLAPVVFALAAVGRLLAPGSAQDGRRARLARGLRELGVLTLATFLNPSGPWVYAYAWGLGRAVDGASVHVEEWLAPSVRDLPGVLFFVLAAAGMVLAVVRRRRLGWPGFLPHLLLAVLSLASQRFVAWWALSAVVALAPLGGPAAAAEHRRGSPRLNLALLAGFALLVLACVPGAPLFERVALRAHLPYPGARVFGGETPWRTAEALAGGYRGRLFHTQAVGGLLEWTLASSRPRPVAFVDQRFEIIPASVWRDYFAICQARGGWPELLRRHGIDTLLIDEAAAAKLMGQLAGSPEWRLVRRELAYALYERVP